MREVMRQEEMRGKGMKREMGEEKGEDGRGTR